MANVILGQRIAVEQRDAGADGDDQGGATAGLPRGLLGAGQVELVACVNKQRP
jgi:hypothetical protein